MRVFVIGDIHAQAVKFWAMLREAGLADADGLPGPTLTEADTELVLLGDLVHAKSRDRYGELAGVQRYDEFDQRHLKRAEQAQERFLREVKRFVDAAPAGRVTILMGNHDYNAIQRNQGPLRTDDVSHLEWKEGYGNPLDPELAAWIEGWPFERVIEGLHLAHVGPLPEHNTFDNDFYLQNRRRWIYEEEDYLEGTSYRLGIYGHTPVRGGVNIASQGRAILLDTNGHGEEYVVLEVEIDQDRYRLKMRGLFFDEIVQR